MERKYESMLIVRPDLDEDERKNVFDKISDKITNLGGKILESKIWIKDRNLCYPIRSRGAEKKKYNKGLYWLVNFALETEKLDDLNETVKLEEKILRNIIIKRSKD
ncbi:MAG: 30S ribosomal protein S6 [Candidatus Omnitrophica bacterium]|nr:30S ribosomal protein S6 [Candidatus Omnitrophota bacterium]